MIHEIRIRLTYIEHLNDVHEWMTENIGHINEDYTIGELSKGVTTEKGRPEIMFTHMTVFIEDTRKAATTKLRWG